MDDAREVAAILQRFNTIPKMMEYLGKHVMIRYDPERVKNMFTITVNSVRLGDTDDPYMLLLAYTLQMLKNREKEDEDES